MSAGDICLSAARRHGCDPSNLMRGGQGANRYAKARGEAMAAIRAELGWSYPAIGKYFGGFHHTSVMSAIWRSEAYVAAPAKKKMPTRRDLERKIESLMRRVRQLERLASQGLLASVERGI